MASVETGNAILDPNVKQSSRKLHKLVEEEAYLAMTDSVLAAVESDQFEVAIAIVSHKRTPERKSDNPPIFSRISLRRAMRGLSAMRLPGSVHLVPDATN